MNRFEDWIFGILPWAGGLGLAVAALVGVWGARVREPFRVRIWSTKGSRSAQRNAGRPLKVMTWNVQYFAGKDFVFYYDLLDGSGPDWRPTPEAIGKSLTEVVRAIQNEDPDIVLLQEIDDGSKRTDYQDQLVPLQAALEYPYSAETFYWKNLFVPHPKIWGSVGMKLVTLSKVPFESVNRWSLPRIPENFLRKAFNLQRAVLEVVVVWNHQRVRVLNTHLDAFAQGTPALKRQIAALKERFEYLDHTEEKWLAAGDFNLLPDRHAFARLSSDQQAYFNSETELQALSENWNRIPSIENTQGSEFEKWLTHFPNNPKVTAPNQTIDYFFYCRKIHSKNAKVRREMTASDHFPVVAEFEF